MCGTGNSLDQVDPTSVPSFHIDFFCFFNFLFHQGGCHNFICVKSNWIRPEIKPIFNLNPRIHRVALIEGLLFWKVGTGFAVIPGWMTPMWTLDCSGHLKADWTSTSSHSQVCRRLDLSWSSLGCSRCVLFSLSSSSFCSPPATGSGGSSASGWAELGDRGLLLSNPRWHGAVAPGTDGLKTR